MIKCTAFQCKPLLTFIFPLIFPSVFPNPAAPPPIHPPSPRVEFLRSLEVNNDVQWNGINAQSGIPAFSGHNYLLQVKTIKFKLLLDIQN